MSKKTSRGPGRPKKEICIDPEINTEINLNSANIVPVTLTAAEPPTEYTNFADNKSVEFRLSGDACASFEKLWDFLCKINPIQIFVFDVNGIYSVIECPEIQGDVLFRMYADKLIDYKIREKLYVKFNVNRLRTVIKTIKKDKMLEFTVNKDASNIALTIFDEFHGGVAYNVQRFYIDTRISIPEETENYQMILDYSGILCLKHNLLEKNIENTRQIFKKVELHCTPEQLEIYGLSTENDNADNVSGLGNILPRETVMVFLKTPEKAIDKRFMSETLIKYAKNIKCTEITKLYFSETSPFCIEYDIKALGTIQLIIPIL